MQGPAQPAPESAPPTPSDASVVYSANLVPTDASKVGSTVNVLTEKDIEKQSRPFLQNYLETLPGVSVSQNGPAGSVSTINIRGVANPYIKVLVDGIDISDPAATQTATAFEHLLVGDVQRVELLKGSQSTLYGGDAVGASSRSTRKRRPWASHKAAALSTAHTTQCEPWVQRVTGQPMATSFYRPGPVKRRFPGG